LFKIPPALPALFFAALVYKVAPRTNGQSKLDMAVQGLLGVGIPISRRVRVTFAAEAPFAFHIHRTLGLTLLTGISIRLESGFSSQVLDNEYPADRRSD